MKELDKIQQRAFLNNLEKAYTEGIYADTPANRKLGRVGMTYTAYAEKVKKEGKERELINKTKNSNIEYSKMTLTQIQKFLVGKTVKIGGKIAKIVNAFKSSVPGTNKVYVEVVAGSDYLGKYISLSTKELENGKTKWDNKYYGGKGQTIEVGDEEPEKKEITKESFEEFLNYMRNNIDKKDTDEFLNKEYMFMFTVPQKYRSKDGNIHNRVVATLKKLSDANNW